MTHGYDEPMTAPIHDPEDGEEREESGAIGEMSLALTAVDRASIDAQVATAKAHPRSVTKALREATTLATLDQETAESMVYALKRGGKVLEGPSARLAEIMAYSWGNLRVDADVVGEDQKWVTAMGTCFDLEKNVAVRVRVRRRITGKDGRRFNDDMIGVTSNAAISIAVRNSVFKVVPRAFVNQIYQKARKASLGKAGTMTQTRQALLDWWGKAGATPEQVFQLINVKGLDDIGEDQIIQLRGLANAIKDGEQSIETLLRPTEHSDGTNTLNEALGTKPTPRAAAKNAGATTSVAASPKPEPSATTPAPTTPAVLPFKQGVSAAGTPLDQVATKDLSDALKFADGQPKWADFCQAAVSVLETRDDA